jgi:hypothetical protein
MSKVSLRPQYTETGIRSFSYDELPGFSRAADVSCLFTDVDAPSLWQPVLSATIVTRLKDGLHVLTGKRTSTANKTHANVASTPTMRIPAPDARLLLAERALFNLQSVIDPLRPFVSESVYPSVAKLPDNTDPLAAKICGLLASKLQLGSALELAQNQEVGRASLARYIVGFSYLEDNWLGEPLYEPLVMLGTIVGLDTELAEQIPFNTPSYSNLGWTPIEQYVHGVATKSLLEVIPTASPEDEIEVCVRGLCNATSSTILADPLEIRRHLSEEDMLPRF